jgi:hypothetical protein
MGLGNRSVIGASPRSIAHVQDVDELFSSCSHFMIKGTRVGIEALILGVLTNIGGKPMQ